MRPSWWPPRIFKTFSWGLFGHPRSLQGGEKALSWLLRARGRPQNRSTPVLQGGRAPWALPPCKTGVNLACARGIVNMESIGLVAICGAPSGDLEAPKQFFKKASQLKTFFFGAFCPHSRWPRHPVKMEGIELASFFEAPSAFRTFGKSGLKYFSALFDVVTEHRQYAVNICGWSFLIFITFSTWSRDTVNMQ